ncbi:hypothetical protein HDA32_004277 [Spinactinospora alkalitolerans]|uniref:Uncharacterized protein n=1 Tax=Spinactinospora alkalitolerans TaxID=687207 RepID=A0A852U0S4_9ACTN|nr:hypothetical protein [Spinactinospora alkalitolerans]
MRIRVPTRLDRSTHGRQTKGFSNRG